MYTAVCSAAACNVLAVPLTGLAFACAVDELNLNSNTDELGDDELFDACSGYGATSESMRPMLSNTKRCTMSMHTALDGCACTQSEPQPTEGLLQVGCEICRRLTPCLASQHRVTSP
jgi:hypothetical protein